MAGKALENGGKENYFILLMMMPKTTFPALNDSGLLLHIDWECICGSVKETKFLPFLCII
jgi:hypothetical protein